MSRSRRFTTAATLVMALGALSPAAASARPFVGNPVAQVSQTGLATVHAITPQNSFDWGDAGIGAVGGLALSALGVGGAFVISNQRRGRRPARPPAPTI